jgi:hypothetical protein
MTLADLFPDEDYGFKMRFERGPAGEFFHPTARHDELIAQRRHWIEADPENCLALLPDGVPLLEETLDFARTEGTLPPTFNLQPAICNPQSATPNLQPATCHLQSLASLGSLWEPDFLLLKLDSESRMRLLAGCVCFPSSWSLTEKIGHPIETIHGVVPGLNHAIGNQIHSFLSKLRPGVAWLRANWGLSRSPELNQHPQRKLPRLDADVGVEEVWLRVEHQTLVALPRTQGVLFGIRIAVHPLAALREDRLIAERLSRALRSMPEPMAQYKGIATARDQVLTLLA